MKTILLLLSLLGLFGSIALMAHNDTDRLLIHEWGTFTVLQDANGNPIQG